MNDGIILQARTGSTRLRNKILLPFYGEQRIIDILIDNIRHYNPGKKIILATTHLPQDDVLEEIAIKSNIHCFRGEEENVLSRFVGAAETFGLDRFIRVCSDNPFLLANSFQQLFDEHNANPCDYVAFGFKDGMPTIKSHLGLFAELTTTDALKRVSTLTQEKLFIEHVTIYLYTHPEQFSIRLLALPSVLEDRFDLRFTLDTAEDLSLLGEVYAAFLSLANRSLENLIELVSANPEWKAKMLGNIRKNEK